MAGRTGQLDIVLDQDAVVERGDASWAKKFSGGIEARAVENDVVGLPLRWRARGVHEGRELAVDRGCLAVGVSFIFVGVEDLHFVEAVQEDAAVAAVLILTFRGLRLGEFDVELAIAERFAGVDVAGLGDDFEISVLYFPLGWRAVFALPLGEIFSVEKDDSVGGRAAGRFLCACRAGIDYWRDRAVRVVDLPFGVDLGLSQREGGEGEEREGKNGDGFFHCNLRKRILLDR